MQRIKNGSAIKTTFAATCCLLLAGMCMGQTLPQPVPQEQGSAADGPTIATPRRGTAGTITSIGDGKITIQTVDGKAATLILTPKTQFHQDRQPAKLSGFKVGDAVLVRGQASGDNQWQAEIIAKRSNNAGAGEFRDALGKRFIVGEIKAVNGLQLLVLRPDGVTQTITVDENTSFRRDGESITLADFKIGDHVFGRGELKAGVFVPTVLGIGDAMAMMMGQAASEKSKGK